jgi:hypothetical protein
MAKFIALMELLIQIWPLIKALLDAITDPAAKKVAEDKVAAALGKIVTDVMKA